MDKDILDISNKPTQIAILHINNDQFLFTFVTSQLIYPDWEVADRIQDALSHRLDSWAEQVEPTQPPSISTLFIDLLRNVFLRINWLEIVSYYRKRLAEEREQ